MDNYDGPSLFRKKNISEYKSLKSVQRKKLTPYRKRSLTKLAIKLKSLAISRNSHTVVNKNMMNRMTLEDPIDIDSKNLRVNVDNNYKPAILKKLDS